MRPLMSTANAEIMPMKQLSFTFVDSRYGTQPRKEPLQKMLSPELERAHKLVSDYEKDPNGRDPKSGGSKLDAGKVNVVRGALHYFPRAITAVAELSGIGAKKYSWKGWETVPDGIHRYGDAMGRHELRIEDDFSKRDSDTGVLEATAVSWNALARLELILRQNEVADVRDMEKA